MPGGQPCHFKLNASVQGLEDNLKRYMKSPVLHDAFPTEQSNSEDVSLNMPIVPAKMSALSCATESVSAGARGQS